MKRITKPIWFCLGLILLGIAYVGVVTPGIPWSTPSVAAAYCFARSNQRWHDWLMNHKLFGAFLVNWSQNRVFPLKGKILMVITMDISLLSIWFTTYNVWLTMGVGLAMMLVAAWIWRYPSSLAVAQSRKARGEPLGWF
jgi:uncharacterized membrane protein YbaN (DUF454 family)